MDEPNITVCGNGFTAKVPDKWQDHSLLNWTAPKSAGEPVAPNIKINRSYPLANVSLQAHVNQQVQEMLNTESGIDIEKKSPCQWCGVPAIEVFLQQSHNGLSSKQRHVYVLPEPGRSLKIVFTAAASDFEQHLLVFNSFEASFVWDSLDYSY